LDRASARDIRAARLILLLSAAVTLCIGCDLTYPEWIVAANSSAGSETARGRALIQQFGCGSCHTIPGVQGARGLVGPPLLWFARRSFIAGELPNTPDNLVLFLRSPQTIHPRTAMPSVGLSELQARDVAAYLYTLR
jgi:cytochrome c1